MWVLVVFVVVLILVRLVFMMCWFVVMVWVSVCSFYVCRLLGMFVG